MDSHCGWSALLLLAVSVVFITQQCPHHQGPSLEVSPFVGMKPGSGPRVGDSDTGHHASRRGARRMVFPAFAHAVPSPAGGISRWATPQPPWLLVMGLPALRSHQSYPQLTVRGQKRTCCSVSSVWFLSLPSFSINKCLQTSLKIHSWMWLSSTPTFAGRGTSFLHQVWQKETFSLSLLLQRGAAIVKLCLALHRIPERAFLELQLQTCCTEKTTFLTKISRTQKVSEQFSWQSLCMFPTTCYYWKSGNSDLSLH